MMPARHLVRFQGVPVVLTPTLPAKTIHIVYEKTSVYALHPATAKRLIRWADNPVRIEASIKAYKIFQHSERQPA